MARLKGKSHRSLFFEELEPRLLFSADGLDGVAVEAVEQPLDEEQPVMVEEEVVNEEAVSSDSTDSDQTAEAEATGSESTGDAPVTTEESTATSADTAETEITAVEAIRREIVVVNDNIDDYQTLIDAIEASSDEDRDIEIFVLDSTESGVEQLSALLSEQSNISALHILTHGTNGTFVLGSETLDSESLLSNEASITSWQSAFTDDADILLYGCNIAADDTGTTMLSTLGSLTGTDIAASEDVTGSALEGGDWDLEYSSGTIDSTTVITTAVESNWDGVLGSALPTDIVYSFDTYTAEILNASFEDSDVSGEFFGVAELIDSWTFSAGGVGSMYAPAYATDGNQVSYIDHNTSGWMYQTLSETLQKGTDYTLTIMIAGADTNLGDTHTSADTLYEVGLYAGDTFLDSVDSTDISLNSDGTFTEVTLTLSAEYLTAFSANYGEALTIYLWNYDTTIDAHFDDLNLTVATPSASVLENAVNGTVVNTVQRVDDTDAGETFTYNLIDNAGGRFAIDANTGRVTVADSSLIDYETASSHNITVKVTDSSLNSYSEIMTISVIDSSLNTPVNTVPADQSVNEDTPLTFSTANGNALSIEAETGQTLNVTLSVDNGSLTLASTTGLTITAGDGTDDATMTFSGSVEDINTALEGLTFTPTLNYNGAATLSISSSDANYDSVNIDVSLAGYYSFNNSADLGADDSGNNNTATVVGATTYSDPVFGDVLNFTSGDDYLQIIGLFNEPADITLAAWVNLTAADTKGADVISLGDNVGLRVDADGEYLTGYWWNGSGWNFVQYDVTLEGEGWHHVAFSFNDSTDTATIYLDGNTVNSVTTTDSITYYNSAADTFIGTHGEGNTNFDFTGYIDDARIYTSALSSAEINALSLSQPSDSSTVAITVNPVNDAPSAVNYAFNSYEDIVVSGDVTSTSFDVDGDALTLTHINGTAVSIGDTIAVDGGSLYINADGTVTYTPTTNATGTFSSTFTISDGKGGSASSTITATLLPVNDAPVLTAYAPAYGLGENDASFSASVASLIAANNITDPDSADIGIAVFGITGTDGTIEYSLDGGTTWNNFEALSATNALLLNSTDLLRLSPSTETGGTVLFDYRAWDQSDSKTAGTYADASSTGGATAFSSTSDRATLTITNVNDAPFFIGDTLIANGTFDADITTGWTAANDVDWSSGMARFGQAGTGSGSLSQDITTVIGETYYLKFTYYDASETEEQSLLVDIMGTDQLLLEEFVSDAANSTRTSYTVSFVADSTSTTITFTDTSTTHSGVRGYLDDIIVAQTTDTVPTISYTENQTAAAIFPSVEIADVDNTILESATIQISANYASGEDSLLFTNTADITGTWDSVTGTLTLTGTAKLNLYQDAIQSITYVNSSETPSELDRTVSLILHDGTADSATLTTTLSVTAVNDIPVAADDSASTPENSTTVLSVLANDTDADTTDTLTVTTIDTTGTNGTVTITNGGADITYDPGTAYDYLAAGDTATDTFTYTVSDGHGATDTATVTITINGVNDIASVTAATGSVTEDDAATLTTSGTITVTDADNGEAFTVAQANTAGTFGTFTIDANGNWSYTADNSQAAIQNLAASDSLTDTFTVTSQDGTASNTVTITINGTNDVPVINSSNIYSVSENSTLIGTIDVTDIDGDTLTFSSVGGPNQGSFSLNPTTGELSFLLAPDYEAPTDGSDFNNVYEITVQVTDNKGGTVTQAIDVHVTDLNDNAPIITGGQTFSVVETAVNGTVVGAVTATDADSSTTLQNWAITGGNTDNIFTIDSSTGTLSVQDNTLLNYESGSSYTLTLSVSDGTLTSAEQTVTIDITDVNETPFFTSSPGTAATEDQAYSYTITADDPEGDSLTFSATTLPAWLTLQDNGDGTATLSGTPTNAYTGDNPVTINVNDGSIDSTQSFTITVANTNDAPVASNASFSTNEDTPYNGTLPAATDDDGDTVTYSLGVQAANGAAAINSDGTFTYTPDADFNGSDSFTYTVSDINGGQNTYTANVTVISVNDAPTAADTTIAADEDTLYTGTLPAATDIDGDPVTYALATQATNGTVTVNADGTFTFDPTANFNGVDSFTYTVDDTQGGQITYTVSVTVNPINDAPTATDTSITTNEDTVFNGTLPAASDIENDTITYALGTQAANGTAAVNSDGTFSYSPAVDFNGADSFTYTVNDAGGGQNTYTVTVTVNPVNDAPIAAADSANVNEGGSVIIDAAVNDTDIDDGIDSASIEIMAQPANGTVTANPDGTITYIHDGSETLSDSFSYRIFDNSSAASNTVLVDMTIAPQNDAPTAGPVDLGSIPEDSGRLISQADLLALASDAEGDSLKAVNLTLSSGSGTLLDNMDSTWTFIPDTNWFGTVTFSYDVTDDITATSTTGSLVVSAVNDMPVGADDTASIEQDTILSANVLANDSDADDDVLTVSLITDTANGQLTLHPDGSYTYTPNNGFIGTDTFSYIINDGTANSNLTTVSLTITPVTAAAQRDTQTVEESSSSDSGSTTQEPQFYAAPIMPTTQPENVITNNFQAIPEPDLTPEESVEEEISPTTETIGDDSDSQEEESREVIAVSNEPPDSSSPDQPDNQSGSDGTSGEIEDKTTANAGDRTYMVREMLKDQLFNTKFMVQFHQVGLTDAVTFSGDQPGISSIDLVENAIRAQISGVFHEMNLSYEQSHEKHQTLIYVGSSVVATFSLGAVSYILKSGSLMSSMLATMPMWKAFDPVAILMNPKKAKDEQEEDARRREQENAQNEQLQKAEGLFTGRSAS